MNNKNLPVINIEKSGKPDWYGGAFTIAFVYSNKGNYVLKGYYKEVKTELEKRVSHGEKYFVCITLWQKGICRTIYDFYKKDVYLYEPTKYKKRSKKSVNKFDENKFRIGYYGDYERLKKYKSFKRLPNRWIKELEEF